MATAGSRPAKAGYAAIRCVLDAIKTVSLSPPPSLTTSNHTAATCPCSGIGATGNRCAPTATAPTSSVWRSQDARLAATSAAGLWTHGTTGISPPEPSQAQSSGLPRGRGGKKFFAKPFLTVRPPLCAKPRNEMFFLRANNGRETTHSDGAEACQRESW